MTAHMPRHHSPQARFDIQPQPLIKTMKSRLFSLALLVIFLVPMAAHAQDDEKITIVLLPPAGNADAVKAINAGVRMFEARLSAAGGFTFLGDQETDALFQDSRTQVGVSAADLRDAQLTAARRTYAEWAVAFSIEELNKKEYLVSIDVWEPKANQRLHADTQLVSEAGSMNAAARIAIDDLAQRFLTSPTVVRRRGGQVSALGGRLEVYDVQPSPARVSVNGTEVGHAPGLFFNLPLGAVSVEILAEGYASDKRTVTLSADVNTAISNVKLQPLWVDLELRTNVDQAEVYADDELVGKTQKQQSATFRVPQTTKMIRVTKAGFQPVSIRLNLIGLTSHRLEATLEEHAGPNGQDLETADCTRVSAKDGQRICLVPAGDFLMGSSDPNANADTKPARMVTLSRAFHINATEITVGAYRQCVESGVCSKPGLAARPSVTDNARSYHAQSTCNFDAPGRTDYPMNCLNWHAAATYCQWAGGDLPTEAQWEAAARGTDGRSYPWSAQEAFGVEPSCRIAHTVHCPEAQNGSAAVGERSSGRSAYGIHDAAGNVAEWVRDTYEADAYQSIGSNDPVSETSASRRVIRGGSFRDFTENITTTHRGRLDALARPDFVGFRCALPVP